MLVSDQNWKLFGYDVRDLGKHWVDSWKDLLFAFDSPARRRLDDIVRLRTESGDSCYQAGQPTQSTDTDYSAFLIPDELVLSRALVLPAAVEADLASQPTGYRGATEGYCLSDMEPGSSAEPRSRLCGLHW